MAKRQFDEMAPWLGAEAPAVLSGATGLPGPTEEERIFLEGLAAEGRVGPVRATQSWIGNSLETAFPAQVALAALAVARKGFYLPVDGSGMERAYSGAPRSVIATSWGFWRGEGMALVDAIE